MEWETELEGALEKAIQEIPDSIGILFSGGLDSSFIAFLAKNQGKKVNLYSAGTSHSHDKDWTQKAAGMLGLQLEFYEKNDEDIIKGLSAVKALTGETSPMLLLIELPLYFITKQSDCPVMATGQGADELFLGYKKYESEDTSKNDLKRVVEYVVPMEMKIAESNGKKLFYPYLNEYVIEVAHKIPFEELVHDGERKIALRRVASRLLLNDKIAWKQKKASQYSSGFRDAVARMAKKSNRTVHELISEL
ncbi:MAG: asparagine synthase C-terminal domain-containing protein [Thermoplasmata archaeon]